MGIRGQKFIVLYEGRVPQRGVDIVQTRINIPSPVKQVGIVPGYSPALFDTGKHIAKQACKTQANGRVCLQILVGKSQTKPVIQVLDTFFYDVRGNPFQVNGLKCKKSTDAANIHKRLDKGAFI